MATADEVLKEMDNVSETNNDSPVCIIDPETRTITVPPEYQLLGVESDEKVERLYFQCPKIVGDNVDLSQLILFINYQNAGQEIDAYKITDVETDGDNITFSWLLDRKVTAYRTTQQNKLGFSFCAQKAEENGSLTQEWNTTVNTECSVLEGLEAQEHIEEENSAAIAQIWAAIDELKAGGGGSGTPGKDGREIEIQNNGTAIQWRYAGDDDWTDLVQLSDITGAKGDPGENGITPTIGENGNWYLEDVDTGRPSRGEQGPAGQDGAKGDKGDKGEKGDPGATGPKGETGPQGPKGETGTDGITPNIQIGEVTTLEPTEQATASVTGTAENPLLNLGIPRGQDGASGGIGKKYFKKITLEEEVGYAFVPFSEFKGCNKLFVQLYIPTIEEESYVNYVPRIKAANSSSWSQSTFIISNYTVLKNSKMLIMHGEIIIKEYDAYFVSGGTRLQYTGETTNGVNGTSLGQVFSFQDSEESGIYVELYNRTTYSFPIGTEIILVGI